MPRRLVHEAALPLFDTRASKSQPVPSPSADPSPWQGSIAVWRGALAKKYTLRLWLFDRIAGPYPETEADRIRGGHGCGARSPILIFSTGPAAMSLEAADERVGHALGSCSTVNAWSVPSMLAISALTWAIISAVMSRRPSPDTYRSRSASNRACSPRKRRQSERSAVLSRKRDGGRDGSLF